MIRIDKLQQIDLDTPSLKAFDWVLAGASISYGLYSGSALWTLAGVLGAIAAWYRPLTRMQKFLEGIVKKKSRS